MEGQPLLTSSDLCQCEYYPNDPTVPMTQENLDLKFFISLLILKFDHKLSTSFF